MTAGARWRAWSTDVHVLVANPRQLPDAVALLRTRMDDVAAAASRFRDDSELRRLRPGTQRVSALLAELLRAALGAERDSCGLVTPTLGRHLRLGGYDRTFPELPADGPAAVVLPPPRHEIVLRGDVLTLPAELELDLGATAKAWVADDVAARLPGPALVNIGGDIAVNGDAEWPVAVGDDDPQVVAITQALATSSTARRTWRRGGKTLHHVWDPRTGRPAETRWRTVSVAADSCLAANTASTAALILDDAAPGWLAARGFPARLAERDGNATYVGGWAA